MRILSTIQPGPGERAAIEEVLGPVDWLIDGADPKEADIVLCFWPKSELADEGVSWDDMPNLQWIQVATAGVNHIGWDEIPEQVPVAACPGSSKHAVAEYVLGAIIAWARGFVRSTQRIKAGDLRNGDAVRGVTDLTIGFVGYGGIGQTAAAHLAGLGARILAANRSGSLPEGAPTARMFQVDELKAMAARCDVLVCCLPLTTGTVGLVDAAVLDALGDGALLVNVARGPVVDEGALYDWLDASEDRWAHLDVWWRYPKEGHPFRRPFHELANVTMTPHNSPNVAGFRVNMVRQAAQQIRHFLDTGEMLHVQDRAVHLMDIDGDGRR